ncbi:MAG TPA: DeoR family transcriptional regulator [Candidatus Paceibacterota bacterium]|nr:DeoR family transcriptional regulator [Candidatus Paceibacterota bacterium]
MKSILFKGREDWYFCYLKAEKIAHVMAVLERSAPMPAGLRVQEIATRAAALPGDVAHLAAGEVEATVVLADIFSLLSAVRLAATESLIHKETAAILESEYEAVAERLMAGSHPSPFVSAEDFHIPQLSLDSGRGSISDTGMSHSVFDRPIHKDMLKGQYEAGPKGHSERTERILEFIRKQKSASIKDIAATIKGCSEKTIQRELAGLIQEGLVRRVGERRWSQYLPV